MPNQTVAQINERLAAIDAAREALRLKKKERTAVENKSKAAARTQLLLIQGKVLAEFIETFKKEEPAAFDVFSRLLERTLTIPKEREAFGFPAQKTRPGN